jgi:Family of unknown function (DUF6194)
VVARTRSSARRFCAISSGSTLALGSSPTTAFGIPPGTFAQRYGGIPAKGGVVALPGYDPTRLGEVIPHPVYGWMRWVQALAPTAAQFESLQPLLTESLELARAKWTRRRVA